MSSKQRSTFVRRLLCTGWIALLAASGCATNQPDLERERRFKQASSHFEIGVDHMENRRYAMGLREFLTAESLDPENPRIQYGLAEAYMQQGKPVEAEIHLLRALEIYPEYHDARLNLSALYLVLERYPEAADQARILADDPTFPAAWRALTNLAVAELGQRNLAAARTHLELANEFHRTYWPTLLTLGILEQEEGRSRQAISYFEQVLEQKSGANAQAEANYRLAKIYVSLGDRRRAVSHLMTAVAQTPDGEWGRKSEKYLAILR
jgi:Tfp pilus assembly protein PilF